MMKVRKPLRVNLIKIKMIKLINYPTKIKKLNQKRETTGLNN